MKKLLTFSLITLLLASTIGVTVHKHYCESVLVGVSILPPGEEDACGADMSMPADSCSDEHDRYNVDSPLVLLVMNFDLAPTFTLEAFEKLFSDRILSEYLDNPEFYADYYPPPPGPKIYTKVQSFLL